jgi:hypothetical protein
VAPHDQPGNIKEARVLKIHVFILEIEVEFYTSNHKKNLKK